MIEISSLGQLLTYVNRRDIITVIDFYADWCGPCQQIKPEYERMAQYNDPAKVVFTKCNVDRNRDCAQRYEVRAMPTFVVCHGGQVIQKVQGGDLGLVQRQVDLAMGLLEARTAPSSSRTARGENVAPSSAVQSVFAEHMLSIVAARKAKNPILEKDGCDAALQVLLSSSPFGALLVPYLASDAFDVEAVEALLSNIASRAAPVRYYGPVLVQKVLAYLLQWALATTWEETDFLALLHRALVALASCPTARTALAASPFFFSPFVETGTELEQTTVLGALLGAAPTVRRGGIPNGAQYEWRTVMALFPPEKKEEHVTTVFQIQQRVELLLERNVKTVQALLRLKELRPLTLCFLGTALRLNEDYVKTMHDSSPISSRYFMTQLQGVLIELALPIFQTKGDASNHFDYLSISPYYLLEPLGTPSGAVVGFGDDVERILHYDSEQPLPSAPSHTDAYKPSTHLFFLAARAITLCTCVFIDERDRDERQATHPQADARQRDAFSAEKNLYEGLIAGNRMGATRLEFLNHLARWLLHVMQVSADGAAPATMPEAWGFLPQGLVDCVVRATKLAPVDAVFLDGMLSLMLVLMGNTTYFPKPHTHALFPFYLLRLMENRTAYGVLEQHRWFGTHMVRACMRCYIAVEKSTYERVEVRYELSYALQKFLKSRMLCEEVREEMERTKNYTFLEKFSHMAVAEVNDSVDQVISTLMRMHTMIAEGADLSETAVATRPAPAEGNAATTRPRQAERQQQRRANHLQNEEDEEDNEEEENDDADENADGSQTYHQVGQGLSSHLLLFTSSMDMFIQVSMQFPRGVSQNMVAQQISEMLARSLMAFAGPNSKNLKIKFPERYNFQPREVLMRLVNCLAHFRESRSFMKALCHCSVPVQSFKEVTAHIAERRLVSEDLIDALQSMTAKLLKLSEDVGAEDTLWDEAPDFALDAVVFSPLLHPVALPAEVKNLDDLVYVNEETLHHLLLSESKHPFTNEPLTEAMVKEFNARPEVAAAVEGRRCDVQKWIQESKGSK